MTSPPISSPEGDQLIWHKEQQVTAGLMEQKCTPRMSRKISESLAVLRYGICGDHLSSLSLSLSSPFMIYRYST
jgi:hypothetical protein